MEASPMAKKFDNSELSLYRCPHCNSITLQIGGRSLELSRDEFMHFRDMVNEMAMDLPDHCTIYNPKRFDFQKN
jgi:hypothetical protein